MDELDIDPRVADAVAAYYLARERGIPLDPETWLDQYPLEIRHELREFLANERSFSAAVTPQAAAVRLVPTTLPDNTRYTGLTLVGTGGMGAVYRAQDSVLNRVVAVKFLHTDLAADPARRANFLDEAQVASQLQHNNIVPVYDYGTLSGDQDRPYFTMRLAGTRTLAHVIQEHHAAPEPEGHDSLLRQFLLICGAVAYAHSRGVLHRDLKPRNVLFGEFEEVLVTDWGLSKAIESVDGDLSISGSTMSSDVKGTPAFMPPEQARGEGIGTAADVFALGGLLCHMFTGRPVYEAATPGETLGLARRCHTDPAIERLTGSGAPPELADLTRRCLSANPDKRPASAAAVGDEIRSYLKSAEERARRAEVEAGRAEGRAAGERKKRRWQAMASVVLVGALAGGVYYYFERADQRRQENARVAEEERKRRDAEAETIGDLRQASDHIRQQRWPAARAALSRAEGRLEAARSSSAEAQAQAVRDDLDTAQRLIAVQSDGSLIAPYAREYARMGRVFRSSLANFGLDAADFEPAAVAARVRTNPLRRPVIELIDFWAMAVFASQPALSKRLCEAASLADDDPWRIEFRAAMTAGNTARAGDLTAGFDPAVQPATTVNLAAAYFARIGKREDAVRVLRGGQRSHPDHLLTNVNLAIMLSRLAAAPDTKPDDEKLEALRYTQAAIALQPDSPTMLATAGMLLRGAGRADDAMAACDRAVGLGPEVAVGYLNRSLVFSDRLDWEAAERDARRAVELEPDFALAHSNLASVLGYRGNFAAGLTAAERAIALEPGLGVAHNNLGFVRVLRIEQGLVVGSARTKEIDAAVESLKTASKILPYWAPIHANLGTAYILKGDLAAAERSLAAAEKLDPSLFEVLLNQGNLAMSRDQFKLSIGKYEAALRARKNDPRAINNLAIVLVLDWQIDRAIPLATKACELRKWDFRCWQTKGGALLSAKRYAEAIDALRQCVARMPSEQATPHQLLGSALLLRGEFAEALREMELASAAPDLPSNPDKQKLITQLVKDARECVRVDAELREIVAGKRPPPPPEDCRSLAEIYYKERGQYVKAFWCYDLVLRSKEPDALAKPDSDRYNAACAAALAGCGGGTDSPPGADERASLRGRALELLREQLESVRRTIPTADEKQKARFLAHLRHAQKDSDFEGVRNSLRLADMPAQEGASWAAVWKDVETTINELGGK